MALAVIVTMIARPARSSTRPSRNEADEGPLQRPQAPVGSGDRRIDHAVRVPVTVGTGEMSVLVVPVLVSVARRHPLTFRSIVRSRRGMVRRLSSGAGTSAWTRRHRSRFPFLSLKAAGVDPVAAEKA